MHFIYPSFLFALLATAVPVIIHLFNFRRYKKIVFSDIRFLKQVQEETRSQQRIREWIILAMRILAVAFLALAFAQPFIPRSQTRLLHQQKAITLFIDNSFSMSSEGKDGLLFETAKNKARAIVNAYGNDHLFQVLTNDFEGKQQRLLSRNDALSVIDELQISAASKPLSLILQRQKQALENQGQTGTLNYIISDFQKSNFDAAGMASDSFFRMNLVPVQSPVLNNLFIDSAWMLSPVIKPGIPIKLMVRVRNSGSEDAENIAVTLKINQLQKALVNTDCAAGSYADAQLSFSIAGDAWQQAELSIIDHPVTFDDKLFFAFKPGSTSNVLCINGAADNRYISKVFEGDASYVLVNNNQNQIDYASFSKKQLIILNELSVISSGLASELKKYTEEGGFLLIIPPSAGNADGLNAFLAGLNSVAYLPPVRQNLKVDFINTREEIFSDVFRKVPGNIDLPDVFGYYGISKSTASAGITVMKMNNGMPFIYESANKKGRIFLLSAPLNEEWSAFQQHAVFVPFMLKLALGNAHQSRLYFMIDGDKWVTADTDWQGSEKIARIYGNGLDMLSDVKQKEGKNEVYLDQQVKKAGIYLLAKKEDPGPGVPFAMNYKRDESYTTVLDESELKERGKVEVVKDDPAVIGEKIKTDLTGTPLWRVCALLALVFVLIEILLLKLL